VLIDAPRSVFLLIPPQVRLVNALPAATAEALRPRWSLLLRAAARLEIPVVVSRQYPQGLGPLLPELASLLPAGVEPHDKMSFSCCADGRLAEVLSGDRDQIVIAGLETHICVLQTAFDLAGNGRAPVVVTDACAARRTADHVQACTRLAATVGLAVTESVVFEWLRGAAHPRFREIARWVRDLPGEA
jgi:nicotinamidase-related amidase